MALVRCSDCRHSFVNVKAGSNLECRRYPATVGFLMAHGPKGSQVANVTAFPTMMPDQFCSEFVQKLAVVQQ